MRRSVLEFAASSSAHSALNVANAALFNLEARFPSFTKLDAQMVIKPPSHSLGYEVPGFENERRRAFQ